MAQFTGTVSLDVQVGEDTKGIKVEYTCTYEEARLSGPPEDCTEGFREYEVESATWDEGGEELTNTEDNEHATAIEEALRDQDMPDEDPTPMEQWEVTTPNGICRPE